MATLKHEPNRLATLSAERQGKASASSVKLFSAVPIYLKMLKELLGWVSDETSCSIFMQF